VKRWSKRAKVAPHPAAVGTPARQIKIAKMDYVMMPVNVNNNHW
jgi:hypothetical protein